MSSNQTLIITPSKTELESTIPSDKTLSNPLHEAVQLGHDSYLPTESVPVFDFDDGHHFTFDGKPRPTSLIRKWPSMLMYLISESQDDDWLPVIRRIITHPNEITVAGKNAGMTALHAACIRYPPVHIVKAIVTTCPEVALYQNFSGETPLHLASYSASEEVQECLIEAAPQAAAYKDQYGDSPLHFAARAGATLPLLQKMVHAYPEAISAVNERGVTPFWVLPRSFVEAESLEEILEDDIEEDDYRHDWDAMVLFLRYAYYGKERAAQMIAQGHGASNNPEDYAWLVHAAAYTPACPREVLTFLCRMFPEQALKLDEQGYTPLQLAVRATVLAEPTNWNESEDGFREPVDPSEGKLQNDHHLVPEEEVAPASGDAEFIQQVVEPKETADEGEKSVLEILLEWSPKSVTLRDTQGRLPLTNALIAGQGWESIRQLMKACPITIEENDPVTGFSHAQLAAMYSNDVNSIFALVRALPENLIEASSIGIKRSGDDSDLLSQPAFKKCRLC